MVRYTRKKRKIKKRGRKTKKKTGGATCNRLRNNCYDCTTFRDPRRRNKRCVYNLDTGDCRQKNIAAGRRHGRNNWTENADHCMLPTVSPDQVTRAVPVRPTILREVSDGGTPQAVPVLPGDTEIDDNFVLEYVLQPQEESASESESEDEEDYSLESDWLRSRRLSAERRAREPLCTSIMRDVNNNCVISGGKRKKTKRRKRKMRKKSRRKRKTKRRRRRR
tara:strand:+ start:70 stop:732 length:663 start_codon:yes stop_codon:yes gene_type:complete